MRIWRNSADRRNRRIVVAIVVHKITRASGSTSSALDYYEALADAGFRPYLLVRKSTKSLVQNVMTEASDDRLDSRLRAVPTRRRTRVGDCREFAHLLVRGQARGAVADVLWDSLDFRIRARANTLVVLNFVPGRMEPVERRVLRRAAAIARSHFKDPGSPLESPDPMVRPRVRQAALFQTTAQADAYRALGGELLAFVVPPTIGPAERGRLQAGARTADSVAAEGEPGGIRYITVGSIGARKNQAEIIRAFIKALPSLPGASLDVVGGTKGGTDEDRQHLQECRRLAALVPGHINLLGHREDVPQLLGRSDVVVNFSSEEGVPRALREAAVAGVPVIAANLPGARSLLDGGRAGRLVDPSDRDDLTAALIELGRDAELRLRLSRAARERLDSAYSWPVFREEVVGVTLSLTNRQDLANGIRPALDCRPLRCRGD